MKKTFGVLLALLCTASSAMAYDFSEANRYFAGRENNVGNLQQAERLYQSALGQTQGSELLYAVEQLGRVYYYWGELLTPSDADDTRKDIFGRCRTMVEKVNPSSVGENAQYYYWKSACLALWGRSASWMEKLAIKDELVQTMAAGAQRSADYEGGGIFRVMAGVYVRASRLSGLYDADAALRYVDVAIGKDAQQVYYTAYLLKAEILKALGRDDEAMELLEMKEFELAQKLRNNSLPAHLVAESKVVARQMSQMMSEG